MYIEQAFKGLHDWWRYAIGTVLIIFAVILGQIPISIAFIAKAMLDDKDFTKLTETEMLNSLEPNLNLFLLLLSFAIGLVGVLVVAKTLHKQTITQLTTSRKKIDWKRFWFSFIFWGIVSTSMIGFDYMSSPENYVINFKLVPFIILCVIAIVMIPLQTSFEEYLFRGYFMQGLGVVFKNKWVPLLLTSLVFGLLHIANPEVEKLGYVIMVYYIGTGLFLGILTLMDEGMELSLGFHAANNLFTAVLVTADWTAFQTHSVLKDMSNPEKSGFMDVFFPVFVMFPIILFIFSKVYKWTDWKAKLFGRVVAPSEEII